MQKQCTPNPSTACRHRGPEKKHTAARKFLSLATPAARAVGCHLERDLHRRALLLQSPQHLRYGPRIRLSAPRKLNIAVLTRAPRVFRAAPLPSGHSRLLRHEVRRREAEVGRRLGQGDGEALLLRHAHVLEHPHVRHPVRSLGLRGGGPQLSSAGTHPHSARRQHRASTRPAPARLVQGQLAQVVRGRVRRGETVPVKHDVQPNPVDIPKVRGGPGCA